MADPAKAMGDKIEAPPVGPGENALEGYVESVTSEKIAGWAWVPAAPDERLEVSIWLGNTQIGTENADRKRPDLKKSGVGDGQYGFRFTPENPLDNEEQGRIVVLARRKSSDQLFPLVRITQEVHFAVAVDRALRPVAEGVERLIGQHAALFGAHKDALEKLTGLVREVREGHRKQSDEKQQLEAQEDQLVRRLETLEVMQARFDEILLRLSNEKEENARNAKNGFGWPFFLGLALATCVGVLIGMFLGGA